MELRQLRAISGTAEIVSRKTNAAKSTLNVLIAPREADWEQFSSDLESFAN